MDTIGSRIKFARKMNKMTLIELNNLTGISVGNLSDLENNKSMPSANALITLKNALNVTCDWILTGETDSSDASVPALVAEDVSNYLSKRELELVVNFRMLTEERKQDIEGFLKVCLNKASSFEKND